MLLDAPRLYLINSPVVRAEPLRFKEEGVRNVIKDVFLPWFNAYRFFVQNVKRMELVWPELATAQRLGASGHVRRQTDPPRSVAVLRAPRLTTGDEPHLHVPSHERDQERERHGPVDPGQHTNARAVYRRRNEGCVPHELLEHRCVPGGVGILTCTRGVARAVGCGGNPLAYRLYTVVPRLVAFIDGLTNWYVRLNRARLKVRRVTH